MVFPSQPTGRLMDELATDVGSLVESFFGDAAERGRAGKRERMEVLLDIDESEQAYVVTLDVPGVSLESIEIDVHEDTLTIAGERVAAGSRHAAKEAPRESASAEAASGDDASLETDVEAQQKARQELKPRRRERSWGAFERKVRLPLAVENDAVTAELSDGVLVVTLPKADPEKGKRRIPVSRA
ncbi:Hsp20/alpha crystallin family protein [Stieleria sp. TO1_6]|uniref:Hsp20/alpha crystallin family protein n=1 Tax=Stieleria tagensis TaxID=2956795 RepID=UPI00209B0C81|nr:Hsp20/alpha crystallin family protein [Stieleria tagensis]MCO8121890.1 Hsp20/alpha crystallin family protein [Stieleria tagensis]